MVKKIIKFALFSIAGIIGAIIILILFLTAFGDGHLVVSLPVEHKDVYRMPQGASYAPALHAQGNQLFNENGGIVRLRGVMVPDPYRLVEEGYFKKELIADIQATSANVIRVPVHK